MKHRKLALVLTAAILALTVFAAVSCAKKNSNDDTSTGGVSTGGTNNTTQNVQTSGGVTDGTDTSTGDGASSGDGTSSAPEVIEKDPPQIIEPEGLSDVQRTAYTWCGKAYEAAKQAKTLEADSESSSISDSWSQVYSVVSGEMTRYYDNYVDGGMTDDKFVCLMKSFANISNAQGLANGYIAIAESKKEDGHLSAAQDYVNAGKFLQASLSLSKLDKSNSADLANAKALVSAHLDAFKGGVSDAVTEYMVRYQLSDGKKYIDSLYGYGIDSHLDDEAKRLEEYRKFQDEDLAAVDLRDTLENIYTHCLIAFPEINFASKSSYGACGPDCLTPYEFKYLLENLYEKGYIIIDANLVYNEQTDSPNYTLMLPKGKKPLILTFDDVTYDSRKFGRGMVDKLIVDEDGYVCTYTKHKDGTEVISYDNELFPIINAFVREHPDFTFQGARGTLFFTGFDGICGYRTQSEPVDDAEAALKLDRQDQIAQAKVVIEALRTEGWTFGCHGYNHSNMPKISAATFRKEIDMWREEVGAIVGDTQLFCWPYGAHTNGDVNLRKNEQHQYLFDSGFTFFFGCGSARYLSNELDGNGIFSDRKGVTGNVLVYIAKEYKSYLRDYPYLFDPDKMWDPLRVQYRDWLVNG